MAVKVKWIQYSMGVLTFIGVTLTGVLWYERAGGNVHAEDEAECAAATWERTVIPFLFGINSPALTVTNVVTDVSTNYFANVTIRRLSGSSGPSCTFYGGVTNYVFTDANWNTPVGLSFFYDEGGFATNEPPATSVFRFSAIGYADVDVTVSIGYAADYGDFTTSGIKVRTFYKYQSIADFDDQVSLFASPVGGYEYTVVATTNTVNYAGEIYKIDPYMRKGSDDSSTKGMQSIASLLRRTALYTGPTAVRWLDADEGLPAHGDMITSGNAYWTNYNAGTYNDRLDGRLVDYYTLAVSNYTDAAVGVATITPSAYKWYWSDNLNYYDMDRNAAYNVPNASVNSFPLGSLFGFTSSGASGLAESALTGNWWSRNDLGSNVWRYGYEYLTPSNDVLPGIGEVRYIRRSSFVTTNIFNELKTLAEGMTRTACWIPNGHNVSYTNRREYAVSLGASTNRVEDYGEGQTYPKDWDNAFSAAQAGLVKGAYTNQGAGSGIDLPYVLIYGTYYAYVEGEKYLDDPWVWSWNRSWSAGASVQDANEYYGCSLPYPSIFAITNGYVSSIAIYAVVGHSTLGGYGLAYVTNATTKITYSGTFPNASDYNDIGFGYVDYTCQFPPLTQTATANSATWINGDVFSFWQARVNLVGTWSNPTEQPSFDFGADMYLENPPYSIEAVTRDVDQTEVGSYKYKYDDEEHELAGAYRPMLAGFVVVVDWKWKHLNPATPYTPTNFVPEWITANTNKP